MSPSIPVIDLFAGPGGLNEGFSQLENADGTAVFKTVGSFEMESTAVQTLTLRGAYRHLQSNGGVPPSYYEFIRGERTWAQFAEDPRVASALEVADSHVHQVELGSADDDSDALIESALRTAGALSGKPWALIGGPPCQAYSLAGRSRRANDDTFAADKKHFLYREYLRIIKKFEPSVFIMENVKGLLSSASTGVGMFALIKKDLENPGEGLYYDIHSLTVDLPPADLNPHHFIIKSENYGVPQKRHRVILLGVKRGFIGDDANVGKLSESDVVTVHDALTGLPRLRSGISPSSLDGDEAWSAIREVASGGAIHSSEPLARGARSLPRGSEPENDQFRHWVIDPNLTDVIQHESRAHMKKDLERYWFAANTAETSGASPRLSEFPASLQPLHKNAGAESRPFNDRFRVQLGSAPANTIVSHIAKDGHYYIHPDPDQMRSLTVREVARLQSFPDNYFFMGSRTQQYHQVGNAVPPLLANQIARVVAELFSHQLK